MVQQHNQKTAKNNSTIKKPRRTTTRPKNREEPQHDQKTEKKIVILDTNTILEDGEIIKHLENVVGVVIPCTVIEELDNNKSRKDSSGVNARLASNIIDSYTEAASSASLDLHKDGVPLGKGKGKLYIHQVRRIHPELKHLYKDDTPDNLIISAALEVKERVVREEKKAKESKKKIVPTRVVLLSNDTNVRIKARTVKLNAERYINTSIKDIDSIYSGVENVSLSDELLAELQENGSIPYGKVKEYLGSKTPEPYSYEFFVVNGKTHSYFFEDSLHVIKDEKCTIIFDCVKTQNDEQKLGMSALLNSGVKVVTISGIAGSGKTLMAIGAGLQQAESFEKIIITRPIVGLNGQEMGFLPGDQKKKVDPYMQPIYDNIDFIKSRLKKGGKTLAKLEQLLKDESRFIVEPFCLIRGRTFADVWLIVDEAQNLTLDDAKAILTRMGVNSKIILVGDIYQTDYAWMNPTNNGLSYLIYNLKKYEKAAHITLVKGERSELSEWASINL